MNTLQLDIVNLQSWTIYQCWVINLHFIRLGTPVATHFEKITFFNFLFQRTLIFGTKSTHFYFKVCKILDQLNALWNVITKCVKSEHHHYFRIQNIQTSYFFLKLRIIYFFCWKQKRKKGNETEFLFIVEGIITCCKSFEKWKQLTFCYRKQKSFFFEMVYHLESNIIWSNICVYFWNNLKMLYKSSSKFPYWGNTWGTFNQTFTQNILRLCLSLPDVHSIYIRLDSLHKRKYWLIEKCISNSL